MCSDCGDDGLTSAETHPSDVVITENLELRLLHCSRNSPTLEVAMSVLLNNVEIGYLF